MAETEQRRRWLRCGDQSGGLVALNTTYNNNERVPPYNGIMFEVMPKVDLELLTMELDLRLPFNTNSTAFEEFDLAVEVYTMKGSFRQLEAYDSPRWTIVAVTKAVMLPSGDGAIIPAPDFKPVTMVAGERRSIYVTMKHAYLDHNVMALDKTGEVQVITPELDLMVGAGLTEHRFPGDYDRVVDPQFAGVLHLRHSQPYCPQEKTVSTEVNFAVIVDVDEITAQLMQDTSEGFARAINTILHENSALFNFKKTYNLKLASDVSTKRRTHDEWEICPSLYLVAGAQFSHLEGLDGNLLQYALFRLTDIIIPAVQSFLGDRKVTYIGSKSYSARVDVTLLGPAGPMQPAQLDFFAKQTAKFLEAQSDRTISVFQVMIEDQNFASSEPGVRSRMLQSQLQIRTNLLGAQPMLFNDGTNFGEEIEETLRKEQAILLQSLAVESLRPSPDILDDRLIFREISGIHSEVFVDGTARSAVAANRRDGSNLVAVVFLMAVAVSAFSYWFFRWINKDKIEKAQRKIDKQEMKDFRHRASLRDRRLRKEALELLAEEEKRTATTGEKQGSRASLDLTSLASAKSSAINDAHSNDHLNAPHLSNAAGNVSVQTGHLNDEDVAHKANIKASPVSQKTANQVRETLNDKDCSDVQVPEDRRRDASIGDPRRADSSVDYPKTTTIRNPVNENATVPGDAITKRIVAQNTSVDASLRKQMVAEARKLLTSSSHSSFSIGSYNSMVSCKETGVRQLREAVSVEMADEFVPVPFPLYFSRRHSNESANSTDDPCDDTVQTTGPQYLPQYLSGGEIRNPPKKTGSLDVNRSQPVNCLAKKGTNSIVRETSNDSVSSNSTTAITKASQGPSSGKSDKASKKKIRTNIVETMSTELNEAVAEVAKPTPNKGLPKAPMTPLIYYSAPKGSRKGVARSKSEVTQPQPKGKIPPRRSRSSDETLVKSSAPRGGKRATTQSKQPTEPVSSKTPKVRPMFGLRGVIPSHWKTPSTGALEGDTPSLVSSPPTKLQGNSRHGNEREFSRNCSNRIIGPSTPNEHDCARDSEVQPDAANVVAPKSAKSALQRNDQVECSKTTPVRLPSSATNSPIRAWSKSVGRESIRQRAKTPLRSKSNEGVTPLRRWSKLCDQVSNQQRAKTPVRSKSSDAVLTVTPSDGGLPRFVSSYQAPPKKSPKKKSKKKPGTKSSAPKRQAKTTRPR